MDVFNLDEKLLSDYQRFARSFTTIRAEDIRAQVDSIYESGHFWPEPRISINPHFEQGKTIQQLVDEGVLHPHTADIFRIAGKTLTLHRHQTEAVSKAHSRQSFVVTTGTGSGKSMCFFVPIIDAAVRARAAGEEQRTRAIVVYPMNALANSQIKEIEKFISQSGLPDGKKPTFARYTGQETEEERALVRESKPDILLTNFMMLELLMTRQSLMDRTVIDNAKGLDFLVLDELHTYRGRQGADVAMLIRRVRDRLCPNKAPVCIGTSATMASDGDKAKIVAEVTSRLFGTDVHADAVIEESLRRATNPILTVSKIHDKLSAVIEAPLPQSLTDEELRNHPLAIWVELEIGLSDGQVLARRKPITVEEAAKKLSEQSKVAPELCRSQLQAMLTLMSQPAKERGGTDDRAFMAFKLHRFISGAGNIFTTLQSTGVRRVTLDGQRFDPESPEARLYPTFFCRSCGQEYHPVSLQNDATGDRCAFPRPIDETPIEDEDGGDQPGYLLPEPKDDPEFLFSGVPEDYPEDWIEVRRGEPKLRSNKTRYAASRLNIDASGRIGSSGRAVWFIPGKFRFCLTCKDQPELRAREINKLAGLSGEGRSSATTLLISSALRWMNTPGNRIPEKKRKILGFTDNRQDAALQAGHFNDFLFVSLLRAAILAAVRQAGAAGLSEDEFGRTVRKVLGFNAEARNRFIEWMPDPEIRGPAITEAEKILTKVLSYRVWMDQRRGWRFTNPNLEQLGLLSAKYVGLDELAEDEGLFSRLPVAGIPVPNVDDRKEILKIILDTMRKGLAVTAEALDESNIETVAKQSRQALREPWSVSPGEIPRTSTALVINGPSRDEINLRGEATILRASSRSKLGQRLNRPKFWTRKLTSAEFETMLTCFMEAAVQFQMVREVITVFDVRGWQLSANAVRLVPEPNVDDVSVRENQYFIELYETLSAALLKGGDGLFGLEGREHTAQVDQNKREWREWRFRWEEEDLRNIAAQRSDMRQSGEPSTFLPVLFCSPTMELGVDISALNAVYLRNMPPTPANYAQRSGRAGRSGQAALIVTYCAAQSPHDQYYFSRPWEMVSGVVRPPALDLSNRDLIEAHLHAVWLADYGQELRAGIPEILDLGKEALPVLNEIIDGMRKDDLKIRARASMARILKSIDKELVGQEASWAKNRDVFLDDTSAKAADKFSDAFNRWRELFNGARSQLKEANRRSEMPGLSARERRSIKDLQIQANEQIALLERGGSGGTSDFYTYRYLATEGFLPGYNFPRLPVYAYVPAGGYGTSKAAYLQRARFLAIAEFGPRSLIYHEGKSYRVHKAKLPPGIRGGENGQIVTGVLYVCGSCGAAHEQEVECCHVCRENMAGMQPIRNTLRIDNVETKPTERITANDEDRQRQGFEIQTVFAWPVREQAYDVNSATSVGTDGPILHLDYASGALISRINKGLRRRSQQTVLGFMIDPVTGAWHRDVEDGDDETEDPQNAAPQRIVPIVRDHKNATLLRLPTGQLSEEAMATLQHALLRGLEIVFQLEEGEVLTEPVPTRNDRRAILCYEATEGGAGVLSRLIREEKSLSRVAWQALDLMHFTNLDDAIGSGDPSLLQNDETAHCVKGCYKCLLSYYNQPDHELIDRNNEDVKDFLLRLARGSVRASEKNQEAPRTEWAEALRAWKLPLHDPEPLIVGDLKITLVWRQKCVAAVTSPLPANQKSSLEDLGFSVTELPSAPAERAPEELAKLLGAKS